MGGRRQCNWKQMTEREREERKSKKIFEMQTTQGDEKTAPIDLQQFKNCWNGQRKIHNNVNVIKIQYQSELILFEVSYFSLSLSFYLLLWNNNNQPNKLQWIERIDNNEWLDDGPNVDNLLRFNMLFVGSNI